MHDFAHNKIHISLTGRKWLRSADVQMALVARGMHLRRGSLPNFEPETQGHVWGTVKNRESN